MSFKTFQDQIGTIQLSDLDDNFAQLDGRVLSVEQSIVNLSSWKVEEVAGVLYFKHNDVIRMKLSPSGDLSVTGKITAYDPTLT